MFERKVKPPMGTIQEEGQRQRLRIEAAAEAVAAAEGGYRVASPLSFYSAIADDVKEVAIVPSAENNFAVGERFLFDVGGYRQPLGFAQEFE